MAYDTDTIAVAIATTLTSLASDGVGAQALPYMPANPKASGAYVYDGEITYDKAMHRGLDELAFHILLLTGNAADQAAQRRLRKLRDKVKTLVEVDKTLGGLVDHARVTRVSAPRPYGPEQKPLIGCEFTVQIRATP